MYTAVQMHSSRQYNTYYIHHCMAIGMCGIDYLFRFDFLKKSSDSVRNEFGLVRFKKGGSVQILRLKR